MFLLKCFKGKSAQINLVETTNTTPSVNEIQRDAETKITASTAQGVARISRKEETPLVMVHTNEAFTPRVSSMTPRGRPRSARGPLKSARGPPSARGAILPSPRTHRQKLDDKLKPPKCLATPVIRPKLTKKLEAQMKHSKDIREGRATPRAGLNDKDEADKNDNGSSTTPHPIERAPTFEIKSSDFSLTKRKVMTAGEEMGASKFALMEKETLISEEAAKKKLEQLGAESG